MIPLVAQRPPHEASGGPRSGPARFLFVVPPLVGHLNPTIPLGHELMARGHAVAWGSHTDPVASLLAPDDTFIPLADAIPPEVEELKRKRHYGPQGFKVTWQDMYLPVNRQALPGLEAAMDSFRPDVLIVDQEAFAAAAVAELRGVPWVTAATNSAALVPRAGGDKLGAWLDGLLRDFMVEVGLDEQRAATINPRLSPHLVIAFTTRELVGAAGDAYPDHYAFVGPSLGARPDDDMPFPWEWLHAEDAPRVLVSLGTVNWRYGERFFRVAAEAFAGMDARAVLVVSPDVPDAADVLADPPSNILVMPRVPQLSLLPHLDAVVCHGGQNTVCEAIACGLPLVISPVGDDQPLNADQVARAGAGIRVKHLRLSPQMLRDAVEEVLADPGYREAANRLRASFDAAGGAAAAADRLEAVAARSGATAGPEVVNESAIRSLSSQQ